MLQHNLADVCVGDLLGWMQAKGAVYEDLGDMPHRVDKFDLFLFGQIKVVHVRQVLVDIGF